MAKLAKRQPAPAADAGDLVSLLRQMAEEDPSEATETDGGTSTPAPAKRARKTPRKVKETPARRSTGSALGFVTLDETAEPVNALYYGREGSAKTTNIAALANLGRVLVINAEAGLKKGPLRELGIKTENIRIYPAPGQPLTFEGLQEVYQQLNTDLAQDPTSWVGVGFDSVTEIYQKLLEEVSEGRVEKQTTLGREVDPWATELGDYGTMTKMVRHLLRRFRDLPCHLALTALERRDVDDDGMVQYGPAITPALATDLLGYVDIVICAKAEDESKPFRGLTKRQGKYRAKDRYGILPAVLTEPRMDRLVQYVEGTLTYDTDPLQTGEVTDSDDGQETNDE